MSRTIDRIFYNPVENSSRGHPPYPSEISTLYSPPHPLGIFINHPWGGGGIWIFSGITQFAIFFIMAICTRCPFLLSHLNFAKPLMYFVLKFYPGFPSIYPGSRLTVGISALLVMAVVLYHSLTGQALNDILKLIWLHCLGCSDFLQSINALKNYFCDLSWPLVFHWYCSHCYMLVDKKDKHCPNSFCLKDFTVLGSLSFFVEVPIMEQLRKFYSKPGFY